MQLKYYGKNNKEQGNKESIAVIEFRDGEEEKMKKALKHLKDNNWEVNISSNSIFITLYGGVPHYKGLQRFYKYMKKYKV